MYDFVRTKNENILEKSIFKYNLSFINMYNNFFLTPLNLICKIRYFKNYFADIAYLSILSPLVTKIERYYNFG